MTTYRSGSLVIKVAPGGSHCEAWQRVLAHAQGNQAMPCPNDTNGDGDCGKRYCPYCGEGR